MGWLWLVLWMISVILSAKVRKKSSEALPHFSEWSLIYSGCVLNWQNSVWFVTVCMLWAENDIINIKCQFWNLFMAKFLSKWI